MNDHAEALDSLCETASKAGELDLLRDVLEWALRWANHIPREAKKELADLTYRLIES